MANTTQHDYKSPDLDEADRVPRPGLLLVCAGGDPRFAVIPLQGSQLAIGRDLVLALGVHDPRVSRRHALVEQRSADALVVSDAGSSNGTFVDGRPLKAPRALAIEELPRVLRVAQNVFLLVADVGPHERVGLAVRDGVVVGAGRAAVHAQVAALAKAGLGVLLTGESGSGKEVAARVFHSEGPRPAGPFVAVNCATVPRDLAERLLFGARRGAYSGAVSDSEGYLQSADGGTLFLDEVAELDAGVQAKLLRALETHQVMPLGDNRAHAVDVRLCAASGRDLRADVQAGRFREDLYYRIGRPAIAVPPLSAHPEEIPWLVHGALDAMGVRATAALVETCLLRRWPGNVRELLADARAAAVRARGAGVTLVEPRHLAEEAGRAMTIGDRNASAPLSVEETRLWNALREARGNVLRASQSVGVSRARLRRFVDKHAIDVAAMRTPGGRAG